MKYQTVYSESHGGENDLIIPLIDCNSALSL